MNLSGGGWHRLEMSADYGNAYAFVLDDDRIVGDPGSRQHAGALDGPSILTNPNSYVWRNAARTGRPWEDTVVYEIHVGTFTEEGTFRGAIGKLQRLAELGLTAIELMPLAHFPGERGWGYDGVLQFAPHNAYGTPDDFEAFVDAAHGLGMMVFLDVVYNHFGPEGNYLGQYAPSFSARALQRRGATRSPTKGQTFEHISLKTSSTGCVSSGSTASGLTPSTR